MKLFSNKPFRDILIIRALHEFVVFWRDIFWKTGTQPRIIVWKGRRGQARSYREFHPKRFRLRSTSLAALFIYTFAVMGFALFLFWRGLIPGFNIQELRERSVLISLRLQEVEDSLNAHTQYLSNLQRLLSGDTNSLLTDSALQADLPGTPPLDAAGLLPAPVSILAGNDQWPAMPVIAGDPTREIPLTSSSSYLASLQLPALPPVQGLVTRGFNAKEGHYAIDIATSEGTMVRCIGDGYVIFSDWTYEGGHTIAVQHTGGYVSVYKHNQRLLKQVGDRVQVREGIAISGNSGEYSSGPHLHFELWNNGLAQNPANYLIGY